MRTKYILLSLVLLVSSCHQNTEKQGNNTGTLPFYKEATFTPDWLNTDSEALIDYHQIPAFSLTNQLGETVTETNLDGKISISDFFFTTCPGICPKMTSNMALLQQEFLEDDDVVLLSHSVTPDLDGVEQLQMYAEAKGVKVNKWHLLTGDREVIYNLGRNAYFVEEDQGINKTIDEFLHTENFVLTDHNRHIRGIYNGLNKASVNQLIADIKMLKNELTE